MILTEFDLSNSNAPEESGKEDEFTQNDLDETLCVALDLLNRVKDLIPTILAGQRLSKKQRKALREIDFELEDLLDDSEGDDKE